MKKLICLFMTVIFSICMATSAYALDVDKAIDEKIELQYVYTNYVTSINLLHLFLVKGRTQVYEETTFDFRTDIYKKDGI